MKQKKNKKVKKTIENKRLIEQKLSFLSSKVLFKIKKRKLIDKKNVNEININSTKKIEKNTTFILKKTKREIKTNKIILNKFSKISNAI